MRRHAITLAALLALGGAVQVWCIAQAVVPAQDAVRYVGIAQAIERDGLLAVLRSCPEQPLYPAAIWLTHSTLRPMLGSAPAVWVTSAQVAAAFPLLLTVVPIYGFLMCVVCRGAAVAGAVFFCVIGVAARLGADALSDSWHLLLLCTALWAMGRYFTSQVWVSHTSPTRQRGPWHNPPSLARRVSVQPAGWLFLAGIAAGLAVLARKEALVLCPVACLVLLLLRGQPAWRQRWLRLANGCLCLALGMALVCVPYLAVCGATQPRQAMARLLGQPEPAPRRDAPKTATDPAQPKKKRSSRWRMADGQSMNFGKKDPLASLRFRGYAAAVQEFLCELPKAFNYHFAALAVMGAWAARRRGLRAIDVFLCTFMLVYSLATIHFASRSGYLAPRHLLPVVVPLLGWAGEGALAAGRWLASHSATRVLHSAFRTPHSALPRLAVAVAALACLPAMLTPLHSSREGHRQAAAWLAQRGQSEAVVLDTRGWSGLYTGLRTYSFRQAKAALRNPDLAYIVLEVNELSHDSRRGQTLRELLAHGGERLGRFSGEQPGGKAVEVYSWHPERFAARPRGERLAN